jgi:hypothetical protein
VTSITLNGEIRTFTGVADFCAFCASLADVPDLFRPMVDATGSANHRLVSSQPRASPHRRRVQPLRAPFCRNRSCCCFPSRRLWLLAVGSGRVPDGGVGGRWRVPRGTRQPKTNDDGFTKLITTHAHNSMNECGRIILSVTARVQRSPSPPRLLSVMSRTPSQQERFWQWRFSKKLSL